MVSLIALQYMHQCNVFPSSQRRGGCADSQRAGGADGVVRPARISAKLTID
jgi:hypothetical protein